MEIAPEQPDTRRDARRDTDDAEWIVVGSGPAGVACADALLGAGRHVRMLDAGMTLEPERHAVVERIRQSPPQDWPVSDLREYQAGMRAGVGGVALKLVYGSDFAYRGAADHLGFEMDGAGVRPSLALGGLSNVWGAALLPYLPADVSDWPFHLDRLTPHYAAAIRLTGLSGTRDGLEEDFPLHTSEPMTLRPGGQAQQLLDAMGRHRDRLAGAGITFGRSRLAVRGDSGSGDGCIYCRLCMYGCPYGYIYDSADTVRQLGRRGPFTYEPGVVVESVRGQTDWVEVSGHDVATRRPRSWRCGRVFLAAGAVPTAGILLRSMGAYDHPLPMQDSQYFLLPLMQTRRVKGASRESVHALSQVFLELRDPRGAEPGAHIQVYSNSDLINDAIANAFGPLRRPLGFAVRELQDRMLVAQGFLHSRHSSRISITLTRDRATGQERLSLHPERDPATAGRVRGVVGRLLRHVPDTGVIPVFPLLKIAEPGRGFHSGGTFPMSRRPDEFNADLLGRPNGWKRIHAVDATVFPSIPATTITLSVMANAHRIGAEAAAEEGLVADAAPTPSVTV